MVKLFVGNVTPSTDAKELRRLFEKYGHVTECDVVKNYAFVHMNNEDDAKKACDSLNNTMFDGKAIHIEFSTSRLRRAPGMDEVCFRCGSKSHKTTHCPVSDMQDYKGLKRPLDSSYPPAKRVECVFTPSREIASTGLTTLFAPSQPQPQPAQMPVVAAAAQAVRTDPDPLLPRPLDRNLSSLFDDYLICRERYYYVRERIINATSSGSVGGTLTTSLGASTIGGTHHHHLSLAQPQPLVAYATGQNQGLTSVLTVAPGGGGPSSLVATAPTSATYHHIQQQQSAPAPLLQQATASASRYSDGYYSRTTENGYQITSTQQRTATAQPGQEIYYRRPDGTYETYTIPAGSSATAYRLA